MTEEEIKELNKVLNEYTDKDNIPYTVDKLKYDISHEMEINRNIIFDILFGDLPEIAEVVHEEVCDYYKRNAIKFFVIRVDNKLYGIDGIYDYYDGLDFDDFTFYPVKPCITIDYQYIKR